MKTKEKGKKEKHNLSLIVFRDDTIPAFAGYMANSVDSGIPIILFNIQTTFRAVVEEKLEAKQLIISNLMHEFGHALEDYFDLDTNEKFIHTVTEQFESKNNYF